MSAFIDLTGQRFGHWSVIQSMGAERQGKPVRWLCRCDCGTERIVCESHLRNGSSQSCGCTRRDNPNHPKRTHGESRSRLYHTWKSIKARCNPKTTVERSQRDYAGRGIRVCEEWENSYEAFRDWALSNGYDDTLTIERIDVNRGYEPQNCTFIPFEQQPVNRRNTLLTVNGVTKTKQEWAGDIGINLRTLSSRLNKLHWSPERAVSTPARGMMRG